MTKKIIARYVTADAGILDPNVPSMGTFFRKRLPLTVVQKIALTAIVDQADNFNLEVPLQGQVVVRPTQSCEIDGHCLPVSALMYACMFELIDSRMQSVISMMS